MSMNGIEAVRDALADATVCVGFATRGRPAILSAAIDELRHQTLQPSSIIIACVEPDDVEGLVQRNDLTVMYGKPGLPRQRNAILDRIPAGTDFIVFFDDDFFVHRNWLESAVRAFQRESTVACVTGNVLLDGIKGPGLGTEEALGVLRRLAPQGPDWIIRGCTPYGCNMAFRMSAISGLRFDERLVLYGWLEDKDFGAVIEQRGGELIKLGAAQGVHLGAKSGRVSGRRLGYSQVVNPVYMRKKGTMTTPEVVRQLCRNVLSNLVLSFKPEPYVDRRGRLKGNCIGFSDLLRGEVRPERAVGL